MIRLSAVLTLRLMAFSLGSVAGWYALSPLVYELWRWWLGHPIREYIILGPEG